MKKSLICRVTSWHPYIMELITNTNILRWYFFIVVIHLFRCRVLLQVSLPMSVCVCEHDNLRTIEHDNLRTILRRVMKFNITYHDVDLPGLLCYCNFLNVDLTVIYNHTTDN